MFGLTAACNVRDALTDAAPVHPHPIHTQVLHGINLRLKKGSRCVAPSLSRHTHTHHFPSISISIPQTQPNPTHSTTQLPPHRRQRRGQVHATPDPGRAAPDQAGRGRDGARDERLPGHEAQHGPRVHGHGLGHAHRGLRGCVGVWGLGCGIGRWCGFWTCRHVCDFQNAHPTRHAPYPTTTQATASPSRRTSP